MQTAQERRRVHNLFAQKPAVAVSAQDLIKLRDLYERGLVRQALDLALTLGPLPAWTGARAQIMAGPGGRQPRAPPVGRSPPPPAHSSPPPGAQDPTSFPPPGLLQHGPPAPSA